MREVDEVLKKCRLVTPTTPTTPMKKVEEVIPPAAESEQKIAELLAKADRLLPPKEVQSVEQVPEQPEQPDTYAQACYKKDPLLGCDSGYRRFHEWGMTATEVRESRRAARRGR